MPSTISLLSDINTAAKYAPWFEKAGMVDLNRVSTKIYKRIEKHFYEKPTLFVDDDSLLQDLIEKRKMLEQEYALPKTRIQVEVQVILHSIYSKFPNSCRSFHPSLLLPHRIQYPNSAHSHTYIIPHHPGTSKGSLFGLRFHTAKGLHNSQRDAYSNEGIKAHTTAGNVWPCGRCV
jgi:hypothetical protein